MDIHQRDTAKQARRIQHAGWAGILVCALSSTLQAQVVQPNAVTVAGSLQEELGCPGDWQPECVVTLLNLDADDQVWQGTFLVPAGNWEYKAPINQSWSENYGLNAVNNGANIPLNLSSDGEVKFYYDHQTHWITDNRNSTIAVAAGSFQSELGCASDWDPGCLRSWLQDPDGDGVFYFVTELLPAGDYEVKVAISESWDENYGADGVLGGDNIAFSVAADCQATAFRYDSQSHQLTISAAPASDQPFAVTVAGSLQSELGCPSDWQPECTLSGLVFDAEDGVWQNQFNLPAGAYEYKAPLNLSWAENYGQNAQRDGANIPLNLASDGAVKFYYDHQSHWITDNRNSLIATAPGNFQSELGCNGDWDPSCLRSWLQDADGDGIYSLSARLPAGEYEVKVAINESWDENYGVGGAQNGANIAFNVPQSCRLTYFNYDPVSHVLSVDQAPGGPRGDLRRAQAHWIDADTIAWNGGSAADQFQLHYDLSAQLSLGNNGVSGGDSIALVVDPNGLSAQQRERFPHLAGYRALKLEAADPSLMREALKGQLAVSALDAQGEPVDATAVQIPGVLDDLFTYNGDLGVSYDAAGRPSLRLWAPTAQAVRLLRYASAAATTPLATTAMSLDSQSGVWSLQGESDWDGQYYLYEVSVYAPTTRNIETNLVTDPYSISLAADSARSQIINLADPRYQPQAWTQLNKPTLAAAEDIVLYELHVRDFSIRDETVPAAQRGTFAAFAQTQSQGMRHLASLAQAGLSHIHLLPSFDFATAPERRAQQATVDENYLASLPPDSPLQQEAIGALRDQDGFNWGYDPWHYSVPEGSYATDPDGPQRIVEFRQMVQALNQTGLRVVMDVVYNHTTAAGQNGRSVLDRVVPGYYHRLNGDGEVEMSTCCANTASEHRMMEKLLIDSVLTWAKHYKVDGFRFDLMGHHSKANMLKLRAALDQLTPAQDGVDGRQIYLYGEGWNFGEVANNARFEQATQRNMAGTGIGTFSDRLRDGARGGNPFSDPQEQGFINGLGYDPSAANAGQDGFAQLRHVSDWVRIGLAGDLASYQLISADGQLRRADTVDYFGQGAGYTADPQENISYVAAHDNETLFDVNQIKLPRDVPLADRLRVQNLSNALVLLGQGIPFIHAGQEFLRSKSMDRDSFNSGDWFNAIDWSQSSSNWGVGLPPAEKNQGLWPLMGPLLADASLAPSVQDRLDSIERFEELLRIRRDVALLRLRDAQQIESMLHFHNTGPNQLPGLIAMQVADEAASVDRRYAKVLVLINARDQASDWRSDALAGQAWRLHPVLQQANDLQVREARFDGATGMFHLPPRSATVFIVPRTAQQVLHDLVDYLQAQVNAGVLKRSLAQAKIVLLQVVIRQLDAGRTTVARVLLEGLNKTLALPITTRVWPAEVLTELRRSIAQALNRIESSP